MSNGTTTPAVDEDPPPKRPPKFCPWCGGAVLKRWTPNKLRGLYQKPYVKITHVCLTCKVAVRMFQFPSQPLFTTKKAARTAAQRVFDKLEASGFRSTYAQDLYRRGKCACTPGAYRPFFLPVKDPCPIHAPLPRKVAP